jgi:hypothetical protein
MTDPETTANNRQPPPTTANAAPQHGGPRQPGPGKTLGRPKKPQKDKAACLQITLSSPKARTALKRKAKRAKLTPGALIERELRL